MPNKNIRPPRWAERFLEWYCKPDVLEDLQGDLREYFERHVQEVGSRKAKFIYILDVFKFIRFYTIRKPDFVSTITRWIMIGSYIKSSSRNILRHKLFSSINIVGLAISMSVALLIIGMLFDLFSYDKFNEKHARIYRVTSDYEYNGQKNYDPFATASLMVAKTIRETFTGIEDVATFYRDFGGDIIFGEKIIPLSGFWADGGVFSVFSFTLQEGNPKTALKDPFSIVLTAKSAKTIFGEETALGKTITLRDREYTVTGIMNDVPESSHIKFDILGSLSSREILEKDTKNEMAWTNMGSSWVYVLLPDDGDLDKLSVNLKALSAQENKKEKTTHIDLGLQPLDDIMTGANLSNQIGTTMGSTTIWIFTVLAVILIFSACLNYTNLSIARALKRSKEVGIRKTIGATRNHVVHQFITESVIISLLALFLAGGIFLIIKPHFLSLEPSLTELLKLSLSPTLIVSFVVFAILVGIIAGFFPAIFFGKINPVRVLKNLSTAPALKGITARKALIVFQFLLSIIAITTTAICYKQYKHFIAFDLGFNTENVLNIYLQGNKVDVLKAELQRLPEVKDISESMMITSVGNYYGTEMKNPNEPSDSSGVYYNMVDEHYIPLHGHKIIAGKNFSATTSADESEVIVNESVLKRFNLAKNDPSKALDQVIVIDKKPLRIIGVLRDFSYGRANNRTGKEVVMRYATTKVNYLNVKISSSDWPETYQKLEKLWKRIDAVHPFNAKFYNEEIEEAFKGLKASVKVAGFLAFLVICIASIGLLGMVVFTTETRIKEVSIRKVLGSSEARLIILLSKNFLMLVTIAGAIAIPTTYIFFEMVFLPMIENHAPVALFDLMIGFVVVVLLSVIMIWSQTLKVVKKNPADVLKME